MSNPEVLSFLASRRSAKPQMLGEPGPDQAQLRQILEIAARVPDHKKLAPWRFIVFQGDARAKLGQVFAQACVHEEEAEPSPVRLETERNRFMRAPMVVAVVISPKEKPGVPEQEQVLSTGAAGFNLCLAANALGFSTCWLTEWVAYSPSVRQTLKLADGERVAGFVYIGTADERQPDRTRPSLDDIVTFWDGA